MTNQFSSRPKLSQVRFHRIVLGFLIAALLPVSAVDQMPSPHPDAALVGKKKRELVLSVSFGQDGHVSSCNAIKSSGSSKLDKDTMAFITKNWIVASEAGKTAHVPFDFQPAPPPPIAKASTNAAPTEAPRYQPSSQTIGGHTGGGGGVSGGGRGAQP